MDLKEVPVRSIKVSTGLPRHPQAGSTDQPPLPTRRSTSSLDPSAICTHGPAKKNMQKRFSWPNQGKQGGQDSKAILRSGSDVINIKILDFWRFYMDHADRFSILTIWVFGWQLGEADWLLGSRQVQLWASSVQPCCRAISHWFRVGSRAH